jgi:Sulfotransferase domain
VNDPAEHQYHGPVAAIAETGKAGLRPLARRFRIATRRARILPGFIIIGAQRAGTTSLFYYLRRHPDVRRPSSGDGSVFWPKELHFFDERYDRGLDWYRTFFPLAIDRRVARMRGRDLVAGEATPYYLFHPLVPERVAASLPDVRLIALLRDPIERAYSHYQLMVRTGREKLSFEDAVGAEEERLAREDVIGGEGVRTKYGALSHQQHRHRAYITRGMYADQLERWYAHFPREQLMVIRAEDFLSRPREIFADVLRFVGLRDWQPTDFVARNRGSYAPIEPEVRAQLEERLAEPNARLAALLGWDRTWDRPAAHDRSLDSHR